MNKKLRNKKGITLIALIITVIILLILSGIVLNALRGQTGLINFAQSAKKKTNMEKIKEEIYFKLVGNGYMDSASMVEIKQIASSYGEINEYNILVTEDGELNLNDMMKIVEENYLEFDVSNIEKNKTFSVFEGRFDSKKERIYVNMDISNIDKSKKLQNILSIGEDIVNFHTTGQKVNIHLYYPNDDGDLVVSLIKGKESKQFSYKIENAAELSNFTVVLDSEGLSINGNKIFSEEGPSNKIKMFQYYNSNYDEWDKLFWNRVSMADLNVEIGSKEGDSRSTADYKSVRIYSDSINDKDMLENNIFKNATQLNLDSIKSGEQFKVLNDKIDFT